ncbi:MULTISPECIES: hypothetical protein [Rodentibacter]|uniref:Uncharacterized protein n=2 Tax=Rodentibacter TaxID=1960084 RepID=A0A1V3JB52_9PAST|nr:MULTISPECIES: hypothetical protein [Rodentibacter]OOF40875.1 hypothetical protein BKK47_02915 [Rodentibacter mrazii]OOF53866.1 hypothetical protein BKK55_10730 [Rodentibacter genomosp. 2]
MKSCDPNVLTVISPDVVDVQGFAVSSAVRVTAYGLINEETITFKRVHYCSTQPHFERNGCSLITPTKGELSSAIEYQIGTCTPSLTPERNSLIIPYAGNYIPVVNGNPTDLIVEVEAINLRDFSDKELGIEPCGFCLDKTWETTGAERCNQHFVEQEEISHCGNIRWTRTKKRCGYYAGVPIPIVLDEGDCCGSQFMGYLFHPDETRDPDATVEITDCEGKLHGYAYPQAGDGHTLPIEECDGNIIGYAVNNSATAPQQLECK